MNAEKMFKKLRFRKIVRNDEIVYITDNDPPLVYDSITFYCKSQRFSMESCDEVRRECRTGLISASLLKAINKQVKELGWK